MHCSQGYAGKKSTTEETGTTEVILSFPHRRKSRLKPSEGAKLDGVAIKLACNDVVLERGRSPFSLSTRCHSGKE
jgi:hypothetical protein